MPGYFFDSSAQVKLYHSEIGTPVVDRIFNAFESNVRVSRLTVLEVKSAFAIKVRTRAISLPGAKAFHRRFRSDVAMRRLEVFPTAESEFAAADLLVERYAFNLRLRALDSLQLAVALVRDRQLVDCFVAADSVLCDVAAIEGFAVLNPEV